VETFLLLGISLRQIQQYEKAEAALKQADKVGKGKYPDVHWNLALLYAHNLKKFGEAADQLERFLKESPDATNKDMVKKLIKQFREKATTASS
jgi:tetratricopeptide (TPR) repeat protein